MKFAIEVIGWTGAALILGAYALLSANKLRADSADLPPDEHPGSRGVRHQQRLESRPALCGHERGVDRDRDVRAVTTPQGTAGADSLNVAAPFAGIRAVGFDLDGTLIDSLPDLAAAINAMLRKLDYSALTQAKIRTLIGDGAESLVERALAAGRGDSAREVPVNEAFAIVKEIYSRQMFRDSRLYPGVIPTLETLRDAHLALFCVTNKDGGLARALMREAGLEPLLAFTMGPHTRAERKPSPAMLRHAAAQLGLMPQQVLYVGDSVVDMEAAHAAGCPAVAVSYGYDERIRAGAGEPRALIAHFSELTRLDGLPTPGT